MGSIHMPIFSKSMFSSSGGWQSTLRSSMVNSLCAASAKLLADSKSSSNASDKHCNVSISVSPTFIVISFPLLFFIWSFSSPYTFPTSSGNYKQWLKLHNLLDVHSVNSGYPIERGGYEKGVSCPIFIYL